MKIHRENFELKTISRIQNKKIFNINRKLQKLIEISPPAHANFEQTLLKILQTKCDKRKSTKSQFDFKMNVHLFGKSL